MNPNVVNEIMDLVRAVAEEEKLRVTITQALRGGAIAGSSAMVGGLFGGPIGILVVGSIGSFIAYATSKSFEPFHQVLAELPPHRKQRLTNRLLNIMNNRGIADTVGLAAMAVAGAPLRDVIIMELINFAHTELNMNVNRP